ncbi:MAG: helix-turn-helix domain-containing protein [Opitutaceae bacterium]|nr:helix-turn-helix domain-containing protein [Opitutaceae bacterium]
MTKPDVLSIVPPTRLLVSGQQESRSRCFAWRPQGTRDWLLVLTEGGRARFRFYEGEFIATRHDVVLVRPGTVHDYELDERYGYWKNIWVHFLPRPDVLGWLRWPEVATGIMHLRLAASVFGRVRKELLLMDAEGHATGRGREQLAVNALERALLFCDAVNPRHEEGRLDERIRKAVDMLGNVSGEGFTLEGLAVRCGLSRSRFAELFRKQVGMPPLAFLENRRLLRVRELLEHTSLSLAEIATQTGFSNAFYLSLRFKKNFGASPREHRRRRVSENQ